MDNLYKEACKKHYEVFRTEKKEAQHTYSIDVEEAKFICDKTCKGAHRVLMDELPAARDNDKFERTIGEAKKLLYDSYNMSVLTYDNSYTAAHKKYIFAIKAAETTIYEEEENNNDSNMYAYFEYMKNLNGSEVNFYNEEEFIRGRVKGKGE